MFKSAFSGSFAAAILLSATQVSAMGIDRESYNPIAKKPVMGLIRQTAPKDPLADENIHVSSRRTNEPAGTLTTEPTPVVPPVATAEPAALLADPNVFEVQTSVAPRGWFTADLDIRSDVPLAIVVNRSVEGATFLYSVTIKPEPEKTDEPAAARIRSFGPQSTSLAAIPVPAAGWLLLSGLIAAGAMRRRA